MSDDDTTIIEQAISRDDAAAAASTARERAEIAKGLGDPLAAETWRDIADEIERQSRQEAAARCKGREG